ncbi:MAG: hypothetical protein MUC53_01080 [Candidatus Contendobacter sp.]|nr:hypothetical protein [Candidatus Contendobacter sp.]
MTTETHLDQLKALLAQVQQAPAAGGWAQPQPTALPITGISIPVKIDTPLGSVRVDLHLPAEFGQSAQALLGAVQLLSNAGLPVDAWQPRDSGGGGWGNRGGGYGGGGGGYNRGGFGGGRRW